MKRYGTNRIKRFLTDNRRCLLFLLLPLCGSLCGIPLYSALKDTVWASVLTVERVTATVSGFTVAWLESCFQPLLLLAVLFVSGLSACGVPVSLAVPLFWGFGLGITQAHYYMQGIGGIAVLAAVLLPHAAMEAVALLMGASESYQMSLRFAVQLLPRSAHCGGLWQDFRLYIARFLVLLALLIGAGALDVGMRLLCAAWL